MKVRALDHVAVTVSDTQRALDFYVRMVGLVQVEQHRLPSESIDPVFGLNGAAGTSTRLQVPGSPGILIDIMEMDESKGGETIPQLGTVGACHIALTVDDLVGAVADLKARGVSFISDPVTFHLTQGSVTVCFMRDPDGNFIELMEQRAS
jgi:catechol 2,3-dioxygenase-like lactoylglutathione lyase family enzyme